MSAPGSEEEAQEMYDLYVAAEKAILLGQSYQIGNRALSRADLRDVVAQRKQWGIVLMRIQQGGGIRVKRVVPRDE